MRPRKNPVVETKPDLDADVRNARDLLQSEPRVLRLRVKTLAAREDEFAEALFTCAAGHKFEWTTSDWQAVLAKLDCNKMLVRDWLGGLNA